eukprot:GHVR01138872.1.p1 GENE.GHVR01138872.1~~GHVR01138872.1.p1  ORF type:complete len:209 (-),score=67.48 GHVR01138872.1:183-809(-)
MGRVLISDVTIFVGCDIFLSIGFAVIDLLFSKLLCEFRAHQVNAHTQGAYIATYSNNNNINNNKEEQRNVSLTQDGKIFNSVQAVHMKSVTERINKELRVSLAHIASPTEVYTTEFTQIHPQESPPSSNLMAAFVRTVSQEDLFKFDFKVYDKDEEMGQEIGDIKKEREEMGQEIGDIKKESEEKYDDIDEGMNNNLNTNTHTYTPTH